MKVRSTSRDSTIADVVTTRTRLLPSAAVVTSMAREAAPSEAAACHERPPSGLVHTAPVGSTPTALTPRGAQSTSWSTGHRAPGTGNQDSPPSTDSRKPPGWWPEPADHRRRRPGWLARPASPAVPSRCRRRCGAGTRRSRGRRPRWRSVRGSPTLPRVTAAPRSARRRSTRSARLTRGVDAGSWVPRGDELPRPDDGEPHQVDDRADPRVTVGGQPEQPSWVATSSLSSAGSTAIPCTWLRADSSDAGGDASRAGSSAVRRRAAGPWSAPPPPRSSPVAHAPVAGSPTRWCSQEEVS